MHLEVWIIQKIWDGIARKRCCWWIFDEWNLESYSRLTRNTANQPYLQITWYGCIDLLITSFYFIISSLLLINFNFAKIFCFYLLQPKLNFYPNVTFTSSSIVNWAVAQVWCCTFVQYLKDYMAILTNVNTSQKTAGHWRHLSSSSKKQTVLCSLHKFWIEK